MIKECICDAVDEGRCNGSMRFHEEEMCAHGEAHPYTSSCISAGCGKIGATARCILINKEPDWEI